MASDCPRPSRPNNIGSSCRLQRHLALCGLGSRRACEKLIDSGRVSVDGNVITTQGVSVDPLINKVCVDGKPVTPETTVSLAVYKPPGVVSTCSDPNESNTVLTLVPDMGVRLYHAGRLDKDSEGLLILTNDGELTNALTHPKHLIEKEYIVWTTRPLSPNALKAMINGIESEGELLKAVSAKLQKDSKSGPRYRIVLREGRKRQIRRMIMESGSRVARLKRVSVGPIQLGALKPGEWRKLEESEIRSVLQSSSAKAGLSRRRPCEGGSS